MPMLKSLTRLTFKNFKLQNANDSNDSRGWSFSASECEWKWKFWLMSVKETQAMTEKYTRLKNCVKGIKQNELIIIIVGCETLIKTINHNISS